jgi:hypothetical protein
MKCSPWSSRLGVGHGVNDTTLENLLSKNFLLMDMSEVILNSLKTVVSTSTVQEIRVKKLFIGIL